MARFIAGRLIALVITLLVASLIIYGGLFLAPGDPATLLAGGGHASPQALNQIREQNHLNDPFVVQYLDWLKGAIHGQFGNSFIYNQSVSSLVAARAATTFWLVLYSAVLIMVAGISIGVLSALRKRTGTVMTIGTSIGLATPTYVAAILLIAFFAVRLGWFPVFGSGSGFTDTVRHLTLPAVALALAWTAFVAQLTSASIRSEMNSEHVDTARSRGLRPSIVFRRHVFRNALIPITTVAGLTVAGLVAGDVVAEQAFGLSGIGAFLVQATEQHDIKVVQAISLMMVALFVVVNTIVDVVNALLDPRIRTGVIR